MATNLTLNIEKRDPASKRGNNRLRSEGYVPASLCAKGEDSLAIVVKREELNRLVSQAGDNAVFSLKLKGKKAPTTAMLREVQTAPMTNRLLHVTFQKVAMDEPTKADVPLNPVGREQIEIKRLESLQLLDILPVVGLPGDIPNTIDIDVSKMEAGDTLRVADIVLPEGLTTDADPDRDVFTVTLPRIEEEETPAAAEGETEAPVAEETTEAE